MYVDREGWLQPEFPNDPGCIRVPTERTSPLEGKSPLGIVHHTTDDPPTDQYPFRLARAWEFKPKDGQRSASCHLIVALRGMIYQLAPFTVGTWHTRKGGEIGGRVVERINHNSIGVEWVNGGRLKYVDDSWRTYDYGTRTLNVDPKLAVKADGPRLPEFAQLPVPKGGVWCAFTLAQEETCYKLLQCLQRHYGWSWRDLTRTHAEYNPESREDPGGVFLDVVLPRVKARLYPEAGANA